MKKMWRILSLRAVFTLVTMLTLCMTAQAVSSVETWAEYGAAETGLTIYEETGGDMPAYGLKDSAGNVVLPAKYQPLLYAGGNRLLVGNQNPFACNKIIDLQGNVLYQDGWQSISYCRDADVFIVSRGDGLKQKEFLLDTNFHRITGDYLSIYYEGGRYFQCEKGTELYSDDKAYGMYKVGTGEIIPVKYSSYIRRLKGDDDLFITEDQNYMKGLYDGNGKQVLPEIYSLIDSVKGNCIIAAKYKKAEYACKGNDQYEIKNGEMINAFGIVDIDGNEILPFAYDHVRFTDGGDVEAMLWNGTTSQEPGRFVGSVTTVYYYDTITYSLADLLKNQPTLIDVPDDVWYSDAVQWAVDRGMIDGTARYLRPNENASRGEVVEYLWKAAGSPDATINNPFHDLSGSSSCYQAALWAYEQGITTGTSTDTFSPDATCTRAQVVTFLWRSMNSPKAAGQNKFADVSDMAYYADSVAWAVKKNITTGTSDTTFSPDTTCTRAQILTFLARAYQ